MNIVINISDKLYKFVKNVIFVENESTLFKQTDANRQKTLFLFDLLDAIKNGTPIPEHHGRLVDADVLKEKLQEHHDFFVNAYGGFEDMTFKEKARVDEITNCIAEVVNAPTIIEGSEK